MPASRQQPAERSTLRLTVEYDGTAFCGFQWQPDVRTIAGVLENALSVLFGEPVKVAGAGRTDAGVHATGQVVSLVTAQAFPWERFLVAINTLLPADLRVRETAFASPGFSARFSALERTYVYALFDRFAPSALLARYAYHVRRTLDVDAMRAGAAHLLGEHDFRSFCVTPPEGPAGPGPTVRDVRRLLVERRGDLIRVEIAASGFLHRMVRTIVGTLAECGDGRRVPGELPGVIAARARESAGHSAPAHGLYFAGVRYEDGYDSYAEPPLFAGGAC
jgi:tRNA pseudouridine38-40 synthase